LHGKARARDRRWRSTGTAWTVKSIDLSLPMEIHVRSLFYHGTVPLTSRIHLQTFLYVLHYYTEVYTPLRLLRTKREIVEAMLTRQRPEEMRKAFEKQAFPRHSLFWGCLAYSESAIHPKIRDVN
jgi:hypothetical protein